MKVKLTAAVITLNAAHSLPNCLSSLGFCDQILVIDSGSTDATVSIAKQWGAQVHTRDWEGYAAQRNFANGLAVNDWVLSVDADEVVPAPLREEIVQLLAYTQKKLAYTLPRKTFHSGQWIRHGGWYPNRLTRLYHRHSGTWVGDEVHEYWQSTGAVGELQSDLNHFSFNSISDQVLRNDKYSGLLAQRLAQRGERSTVWKWVTKPATKFIETYLLKKGFLDGRLGFIIAVSAAYSIFLKWVKLWEMQNRGSQFESK